MTPNMQWQRTVTRRRLSRQRVAAVEESDVWGRKVSRDDDDPEALLAACVDDAMAILSATGQT